MTKVQISGLLNRYLINEESSLAVVIYSKSTITEVVIKEFQTATYHIAFRYWLTLRSFSIVII